jgi:hypothetical protein
MQDNDDIEYRYTAIFPVSTLYAMGDILDFVSEADYQNAILQKESTSLSTQHFSKWEEPPSEISSASDENPLEDSTINFLNPPQSAIDVQRKRSNLIGHLLKDIARGRYDLWNWSGERIMDPPRDDLQSLGSVQNTTAQPKPPISEAHFLWANLANIYKSDLIKFCRGLRIHATFEGEQPTIIEPTQDQIISSKANNPPPGKMPNVDIGKLAIEAAWEIQCITGRRPSAKTVIKKLQEWAIEPKKEPWLVKPSATGVFWTSMTTEDTKDYGIGACTKTLQVWRKTFPQEKIQDAKETLQDAK